MTEQQERESREAFEAWARELEYDLRPMCELHPALDDTYISPSTENVWRAWQAATVFWAIRHAAFLQHATSQINAIHADVLRAPSTTANRERE